MEVVDRYSGEIVSKSFRSSRFVAGKIKKEPFDPFTRTERAYVPPQIQIGDMMEAGKRLAEERRKRFDTDYFPQEDQEIPLDPMRELGLDLADVSKLALKAKKAAEGLQERIVAKQKEVADAEEKSRIQSRVEKALAEKALKS